MMTLSESFSQGWQTHVYRLKTLGLVVRTTLFASLCIGMLTFSFLVYKDHRLYDFYVAGVYHYADWRKDNSFSSSEPTVTFTYESGRKQVVFCKTLARNPGIVRSVDQLYESLMDKGMTSLWISGGAFILVTALWTWIGRRRNDSKIIEGTVLATPRRLRNLLRKKGKASSFSLAQVPLVENSETGHMLVVGTTGVGKTNCFFELLQQVRRKRQKAIVVDTTGDFISRFYRPGRDKILNPFDERGEPWNLWAECEYGYQFDEFAEGFIPRVSHDPFWENAGRTLFSEAAQQLKSQGKQSTQELLTITAIKPLEEMSHLLGGTLAASLVDPRSAKTALGIRNIVTTHAKSLKYLEDTENPFSIRKWVEDETTDSWLFLACTPPHRAVMKSLLSGWFSIAHKALMGMQQSLTRKLWFIIDELPSLSVLTELPQAMAEVRKYGGCFVLGLQGIPQLDELYGTYITQTISGLANTKLIFRVPDPDTAKKMSAFLGEQEVKEASKTYSYNGDKGRKNVSVSETQGLKPAVSATKLAKLDNLQAYLQLPGDLPVVKVKFKLQKLPKVVPEFIRKKKIETDG